MMKRMQAKLQETVPGGEQQPALVPARACGVWELQTFGMSTSAGLCNHETAI